MTGALVDFAARRALARRRASQYHLFYFAAAYSSRLFRYIIAASREDIAAGIDFAMRCCLLLHYLMRGLILQTRCFGRFDAKPRQTYALMSF